MDNNELAKSLTSEVLPLIEEILLKQRKAELRIWEREIKSRNHRIRELENLLNRAAVYVTAEAKDDYDPPRDKAFARSLMNDINKALDHDTD